VFPRAKVKVNSGVTQSKRNPFEKKGGEKRSGKGEIQCRHAKVVNSKKETARRRPGRPGRKGVGREEVGGGDRTDRMGEKPGAFMAKEKGIKQKRPTTSKKSGIERR